MEVTISSEHYEIINSGSVIVQMGEYVEFLISNLKFRIIFRNEISDSSTIPDSHIETRVENADTDEAYMGIYLYNQNASFFASIPDLLKVARIDNKPLYFKFSIQSINNREEGCDNILFYTWYLSKTEMPQILNNSTNTNH